MAKPSRGRLGLRRRCQEVDESGDVTAEVVEGGAAFGCGGL
ncbi:hypothetical protein BZL29_6550 [Mycobacterium kansasii]|uniref:Uncharacterized protein n=1 Tax=Mycobacterium kansasii TaxID=1768 RepID=A0A1V3WMR6_MYCKA|nr:hypothetical protein BZL29_6550 [Mycobacterium kansasii]